MTLPLWRSHHPLWLAPHRPFFLLAGVWAFLVPLVWFVPQGLGPEPVTWHRHEMLLGMGGAAMGGYLLTALPAWTPDGPVSRQTTRLLVALWLAGRLAFVADLHTVVGSAAMGSYFLVLGIFLLQRVIRAKARRRRLLAAAPIVPGIFELGGQLSPGFVDAAAMPQFLPLFYALLISLVGGRVLTAFTIHWAERNPAGHGVSDPRWTARGAVLTLFAAICSLALDQPGLTGALAMASGIMHLACILSWRSWRVLGYPALFLLHLAWLWLCFGLVLSGLSFLSSAGPDTVTALHALTMGAMGTMMLAIMGRAAMARCGTRLLASTELALGFSLVSLSVPIRLCMPLFEQEVQSTMLQIATVSWMAGWAFFLWDFRHALVGPVRRPVLSAAAPDRVNSGGANTLQGSQNT